MNLEIFRTDQWLVSHRSDSIYKGYLMVSSMADVYDVNTLDESAQQSLGKVLSETELLLMSLYSPYKVIMSKLGFSKGFSCHFHVIPVTSTLLGEISEHPDYGIKEPNGVDALMYINRLYCEKVYTANESKMIAEEVQKLRQQKYVLET